MNSRTGPVARNGLSLSHNNFRFHGLHCGVKVPGLLLRFFARRLNCPFGPSLHNLCSGWPRSRLLPCFWPVANLTGRLYRLLFQSSLPFGTVTSLRIGMTTGVAAVRPAIRMRPISFRSPQPVTIASNGCGSSFQVRYVSGGLLFLKPLGTFLTMSSLAFFVNE